MYILAPLLLLSGNLALADGSTVSLDEQGVQHATITMDSYSYSPKDLTVYAGKPVEFTFRNTATFAPTRSSLMIRLPVSIFGQKSVPVIRKRSGSHLCNLAA